VKRCLAGITAYLVWESDDMQETNEKPKDALGKRALKEAGESTVIFDDGKDRPITKQ